MRNWSHENLTLELIVNRMVAVSYTHLDVYKRQLYHITEHIYLDRAVGDSSHSDANVNNFKGTELSNARTLLLLFSICKRTFSGKA